MTDAARKAEEEDCDKRSVVTPAIAVFLVNSLFFSSRRVVDIIYVCGVKREG